MKVERCLCKGGIYLWAGQGDDEMTIDMVVSLSHFRNG